MNWAIFLLELLEAMLDPSFGPSQATIMLGEPMLRSPQQWELQPRDAQLTQCKVYFEDLHAGKGLVTTIRVRFKSPWKISMNDLEKSLGNSHQWIPSAGRGRPRNLQFRRQGEKLSGVIMLEVLPAPAGADAADLTIPAALIRRFFPSE